MGREGQPAVAEVDLGRVGDRHCRVDHRSGPVLAQEVDQALAVELAPRGERLGELGVTDEDRLVLYERPRPEDVIRVDMGQDHVGDRLLRALDDLGAQPLAVGEAAARFRDQHAVPADEEADIGDRIGVVGRGVGDQALAHEQAGADLLHRERVRGPAEGRQAAQAEAGEQGMAPRQGAPGAERLPWMDGGRRHAGTSLFLLSTIK